MKSGVIFVNVARGAVADEAALADAVSGGHIGGLGPMGYILAMDALAAVKMGKNPPKQI